MNNKYTFYVAPALLVGSIIGFFLAFSAQEDYQSAAYGDCDVPQILGQGKVYPAQGNVSKSGLYFSRAVTCNPRDWTLFDEYQNAIIGHAQKLANEGRIEAAELESFLRFQTRYLDSSSLLIPDRYIVNRKTGAW